MKNQILILLLTFCFFSSCTKKENLANRTDTVVLAWADAPGSFDPRYATDANSMYLENLVHCPLIGYDPDGKVKAVLAESWHWNSDKELEVKIKSGVKFSDGQPVTVKDVEATYRFFKRDDLEKPSARKGAFDNVEKISTKGEDTIVFQLKEADVPFLGNLVIGTLPAAVAEKKERLEDVSPGAYCGPFTLKKKELTEIVLERNEQYGLASPAHIQTVVIKIIQDESTRYAKLLKGELDLVQNEFSADKIKNIKESPDFNVLARAGLNTSYLGLNFRDPLIQKQKIRLGIAHAIDRDALIEHILHGLAVPAKTLLTPNDPYISSQVQSIRFDPEQAKKLFDEAGYPDPDGDGPQTRFTLAYKTTTNAERLTIAKAIASQLQKVGVQVNVESLEWGKFKQDVEEGKAQLWGLTWIGFKDPDIHRYAFATESFSPKGGNRGWYSNKSLDALLTKGRSTVSETGRKKIYQEVQAIVVKELPYIFLWHSQVTAVTRKALRGYQIYADGRLDALTEVTKAEVK